MTPHTNESLRKQLRPLVKPATEEVLNALIELGFAPETLPALELVPLVFVAWAASPPTKKEREVIFRFANEDKLGDAALDLLQNLLDYRPEQSYLRRVLRVFVRMTTALPPAEGTRKKRHLIDRAQKVAEATGGILGFIRHKVSREERAVIDGISSGLKITPAEREAARNEALISLRTMTGDALADILQDVKRK